MLSLACSYARLKAQDLLSVKKLWTRPKGFGLTSKSDFVVRANLVVPPTADSHGGWCAGWELDTPGYPIEPLRRAINLG